MAEFRVRTHRMRKKREHFLQNFSIRQHGRYECLSNVQAQTYENAVLMAEFVFENLIREVNLHRWRRNGELWLQSLPFPDGIDYKNVRQYISNGYIGKVPCPESSEFINGGAWHPKVNGVSGKQKLK